MELKRWTITFVALLAVAAALTGYKYSQIRKAIEYAESFPEPSATVQSAVVEWEKTAQFETTTGEIVAPEMLVLRNEVAGRVAEINFKSGQNVASGEVLVQLDVAEERARLAAAQARADLARLELRRLEKLRKQGSVSEDQVDTARSRYAVARADIDGLQAEIGKKTLRAPFDAMAGIHTLEIGQILQANTAITNLVGLQDYLWVDFSLPFERAPVQPGDEVQVELHGKPEIEIRGEVIAREPVVSAASRTVRLRARLPRHPALGHNAAVTVRLARAGGRAMKIPAPALRRDSIGEFVYVLHSGEQDDVLRAWRRQVEVMALDAGTALISGGLESGERVATIGAFKLREGMHARLAAEVAKGNEIVRSDGQKNLSSAAAAGSSQDGAP